MFSGSSLYTWGCGAERWETEDMGSRCRWICAKSWPCSSLRLSHPSSWQPSEVIVPLFFTERRKWGEMSHQIGEMRQIPPGHVTDDDDDDYSWHWSTCLCQARSKHFTYMNSYHLNGHCWVSTIFIPILQMRTPEGRKVKQLGQRCMLISDRFRLELRQCNQSLASLSTRDHALNTLSVQFLAQTLSWAVAVRKDPQTV